MEKVQAEDQKNVDDGKEIRLISAEVLETLKETYKSRIAQGKIKRVTLDKDEKGKESIEVAVLVPSRSTQDEFMKFVDRDPGKAQKILVRNCLVSSIDEVHENDYLFNTCVSAIAELFQIGSFEIKNF